MQEAVANTNIAAALAGTATQKGSTLAALSDECPLLLVFLRHFG